MKTAVMIFRNVIFLLATVNFVACTGMEKPVGTSEQEKEMEILYIYPDGRYEFKGRTMDKEDIVIYKDGRGGERAAVKLVIPRHPDVYRDTITVERVDVPVEHREDGN